VAWRSVCVSSVSVLSCVGSGLETDSPSKGFYRLLIRSVVQINSDGKQTRGPNTKV
jgi:hypothetical protein